MIWNHSWGPITPRPCERKPRWRVRAYKRYAQPKPETGKTRKPLQISSVRQFRVREISGTVPHRHRRRFPTPRLHYGREVDVESQHVLSRSDADRMTTDVSCFAW